MRSQIRYAEARVRKGAMYLDKHRPGWFRTVKIRPLDMQNPCRCVIGQMFGSYDPDMLGITSVDGYGGISEDEKLGFDVPFGVDLDEEKPYYDRLTELWREAIRERRSASADSSDPREEMT